MRNINTSISSFRPDCCLYPQHTDGGFAFLIDGKIMTFLRAVRYLTDEVGFSHQEMIEYLGVLLIHYPDFRSLCFDRLNCSWYMKEKQC